jgi:fructose-bisphosphate aldolase class II
VTLDVLHAHFVSGGSRVALVNLEEMLQAARRSGYAVGSFNVVSLDSLQGILEAATELRSPVILSVAEVHFKYIDLESIVPVIRSAAEKAPVPVALHLDHGMSLAAAMRCFRLGFTSLMFDGSTLPYEENVAATAEIVRVAHSVGVTVEAELGHVGGGEGGDEPSEADRAHFTDPALAADFVRRTGVDTLAVAIGSVHGLYKGRPELDFARLQDIADRTGIPLVLHGGSGIPDQDIRRAISLGIAKINVYTEMSMHAVEKIRAKVQDPKVISFPDLLLLARQGIRETVEEKMRIFGSAGVCKAAHAICSSCGACIIATSGAAEAGGQNNGAGNNGRVGTIGSSGYMDTAGIAGSTGSAINTGNTGAAQRDADRSGDAVLARIITQVTRELLSLRDNK